MLALPDKLGEYDRIRRAGRLENLPHDGVAFEIIIFSAAHLTGDPGNGYRM